MALLFALCCLSVFLSAATIGVYICQIDCFYHEVVDWVEMILDALAIEINVKENNGINNRYRSKKYAISDGREKLNAGAMQ